LDGSSQVFVERRVIVESGHLGTKTISVKPHLRGLARRRPLGKGKGCDIGYALAISSCEEANSVDACTVTALDAITAFAVPNPNCPSQSRRFFQVWLLFGLPRRVDHPAYFGLTKRLVLPTLSAVDESKLRELLEHCQRPFSVQLLVFDGSKFRNASR
jgi:hypothetical protein